MKQTFCWCGSSEYDLYKTFVRNRFKSGIPSYQAVIVQCKECHTIRMFDNGEEGDPDYEASYTYERISPRHARTIELIKAQYIGSSLLDIGANTGVLLNEIRNQIPELSVLKGIDLDSKAINYGKKKYGLDLEYTDAINVKQKFQNIVLAHTLEHVPELPQFIDILDALLVPGGKIFISVPNIESLGAVKMILPWWHGLQPGHHIWYFSAQSISNLFSELRPTWRKVHLSSFPIWKPRHYPRFYWNYVSRKTDFGELLVGDQLDFVIEKPLE